MPRKRNRPRDPRRLAAWRTKEAEIHRLMADDRFELSGHVVDKIATNYWSVDDVVRAVMTGRISTVEQDEFDDAIDGNRYTMIGDGCYGSLLETVGKIVQDNEGRLYFLITAY